jgi:tetratricopeptide (TPR) repeat protein
MTCRFHVGALAVAVGLLGMLRADSLLAQEASTTPTAVSRPVEATEPYNQGVQLISEEKYKEALAALNQAIAADGTYAEAYIAKGDALKEMQYYQEAAQAYTQALDMSRGLTSAANSAAFNGRGECFMESSPPDYNMAMNDFTNALDLDRGNAKALSNIGHIYVNFAQDPQKGLDRLDEALAINPQDARAYRDRGMGHAQLREFDQAIADVQEAIKVDPKDYETYSTLATIYLFQDKFSEASDALGEAIKAYEPKKRGEAKTFITGYIFRADARLKLGEHETDPAKKEAAFEGAIADANAVLAEYEDRFPESGRALFRRGRAERHLERYSDAVDSLTRAIQTVPAGQTIEYISDAYMFRGICWFHIGSLDLARGDFERASATGGGFQDPRIFLWIGYTHHQQGDYRQAIENYNKAIAKSPDFALAHVNKGRAYMDLREYKKATESFNNAIGAEPDVGDHYYKAGLAQLKLEQYDKAVDYLSLALKKPNPKPGMYRAIATALRELGRDELAEEYERQAPSAAPAATGG